MKRRCRHPERTARLTTMALLVSGAAALGGCATGGVTSSFFVDPSKYDLYDCTQLATERVKVDARVVQLEGLIAKAETGAAGGLVSGLAYQADYSAARAQRDLIDQKRLSNNCAAEIVPVVTAPPPPAKKKKSRLQ